jgi:hypothetical protein
MSHLIRAGQRAARYPFFLAYQLACYQQDHKLSDKQLAEVLECSLENLARLRLCRAPRNEHFEADIQRIAARAQVNAAILVTILQQGSELDQCGKP